MDKAKTTPVRKRTAPKYPDQYSIKLDRLLLQNRPLRWSASPVAGTVLSAVVMLGLSGCGGTGKGFVEETVTGGEPLPVPYITSPFFEHGAGIGAYGCVSVAAPVFLSEDDAYAIIKDEFEKRNLTVLKGGGSIQNIEIPKISPYYTGIDTKSGETQIGVLEFDFQVKDKNIQMEYVSMDDMRSWESVEPDENGEIVMSSVSSYNLKGAAQTLNKSLNDRYSETAYGTFYDPAEMVDTLAIPEDSDWEEAFGQLEEEARQKSADALRMQVTDFLGWLSAEGII
ncbi:MAG: hypothetical protein FWG03_04545 [Clostridiales bacterium]|nr:hypothetical protein [Clostridiales bacterium]